MKRLLIGAVVALMLAAVPALAADVTSLANQAALRHYAIEDGAPVDVNAMEAMVAQLPSSPAFYFIALASDSPDGADLAASDILADLPSGTVIVVSPTDLGAVSSDYSNAQLSDALDASLDMFDTSYVEGFGVFADTLLQADASPSGSSSSGSSAGGGRGGLVVLVLIAGLIVIAVIAIRRGKKSDEQVQQQRFTEARSEIQGQLDAVANRILELSDQVQVAPNDQATGYFRDASATFDDVTDTFEKATSLAEFEDISTRLDKARWQLEAADAITEGRPVPTEPEERRTACFFDPTHKGGTEEATITTPAGSQTVSVCHSCAERLRKGEAPTPRSVPVNGRRVPVPMAPASHGGGGIDLASMFQVIVAGMGAATQYRTSRGRVVPTRTATRTTAPASARATRRSSPTGRARRRRS
ncbi:MAG: hypothetical protein WAM81_09685 [Acidimicrobiia bacterium]